MFIDNVSIYVKAGDGGNGCNSLHKSKGARYKRPDGGDGGKGGDVYLVCDVNLITLLDFYYRKKFHAPSGKHGSGNNKKGRDGKDIFIKVPPGTIIKYASCYHLIKDARFDKE